MDQYSSALADADGDRDLDVILTAADGTVRALDGRSGKLIWQYKTGHFIEGGPMLGDLNGEGTTQVIVTTDCKISTTCPGSSNPYTAKGRLYVFDANPGTDKKTNPPVWSKGFAAKIDSGPPAIADLDPTDHRALSEIVFGGWDALLHVVWHAGDKTYVHTMPLLSLDPSLPPDTHPVMRTAPLIANIGSGPDTAVFGWMPDWTQDQNARLSVVNLTVRTKKNKVTFTPLWSPPSVDIDTWKSSPALVPGIASSPGETAPLAVAGYGIDPAPGPFVTCGTNVFGGVIAVNGDGSTAWNYTMPSGYGAMRASPAVADVDGDGRPDVIEPAGCHGAVYVFDGHTGGLEWTFDLGPYTINAPSVGDLNGDGSIEIVVGSNDGNIYALGG